MNWKTTLLGVFTILAAVADAGKEFLANGSLGDVGLLFAAVTAGVGLILAKDSKFWFQTLDRSRQRTRILRW